MKRFSDLSEREILALAIFSENEDNHIYRSFADGLRSSYPDTAGMYDRMAEEESGHHDVLLDLYRAKFGDFLPLIRRQDVKGFVARKPIWLNRPLAIDATRQIRRGHGISRRRAFTGARPRLRAIRQRAIS